MASEFQIRPWEHDLLNVWDYYGLTSVIDNMRDEANSVRNNS